MWSRSLYRFLTDDDGEERSCRAIPEEACREAPRSFLLNAANGAATKLAEQLASPGLVLPWLLQTVAAPVAMVGWLEPLRRGGSLLPQLAVAGWLRARPRRKWFWVAAGTVQGLLLLLLAPAVLTLRGAAAGAAVLAALALFSIASGIGSVAFGDVVGKTVPQGKRGQLLALRATAGGLLTVTAGAALRWGGGSEAGVGFYALLLVAAGLLWLLGSLLFALVEEPSGATDGGRSALGDAAAGFALLRTQPGFVRFLLARAALLGVELAIPFYALHARSVGLAAKDLGVAIVAVGLANLLSSPVWGRISDRVSSRLVMVISGAVGALPAVLAFALAAALGGEVAALEYAPVLFLAGIAVAGVRVGRKTYLIDATAERDRPLYVAMSNTTIGALTFAFAALGWLAQAAGAGAVLAALLLLALLGAGLALAVPEPEAMRVG